MTTAVQTSFADLVGKIPWQDGDIEIDRIVTPPLGPEPDAAFVRSVRELGVMSPIHVAEVKNGRGESFIVIDGFRRLRAALECEFDTIPARIAPAGSYTVQLLTLIFNEQRSPNPVVEYLALRGLMEGSPELSETDIARLSGMSVQTIRKRLKLADLRPEFMTVFELGELAPGMADKLAKMAAGDQAIAWERWNANAGKLTGEDLRAIREAARGAVETPELPGMPEAPPPDTVEAAMLRNIRRLREELLSGTLDIVSIDQQLAAIEAAAQLLAAEGQ